MNACGSISGGFAYWYPIGTIALFGFETGWMTGSI